MDYRPKNRIQVTSGNAQGDAENFLALVMKYQSPTSHYFHVNTTWDAKTSLEDTPKLYHKAMMLDTHLQLLCFDGYYDQYNFYASQLSLQGIGESKRVKMVAFGVGHMTYLEENSRPKMKAQLDSFIL